MTPEQVARLQESVGIAAGTFADRLVAAGADAQALYRNMLPAFAAAGVPPPLADAAAQAGLTPVRAGAALRELAAADLVALDQNGVVTGAFPLAASPTRHRVDVQRGPVLYAMCAVDALGIPAMVGRPGVISSTDPASGQTITVRVTEGGLEIDPPEAVVLLATTGTGTLADSSCSVIDFFSAADAARQVLDGSGVTGNVLSMAEAYELGVALFADLPAR